MTRVRQILIFLSVFALILTATHVYMFERISFYFDLFGSVRTSVALLFGGCAVLTLVSIPLSRMIPRTAASVLAWIVYPWMGISLLMFVTLLATDIVWIFVNVTAPFLPVPSGRAFGTAALGITALASVYALWNGLASVRVKSMTINLDRLLPSFEGLRVVQITDLHIGPLISGQWLRKIVKKVNALSPDIIVITGDLVDGSVEELKRHVAPIADLRAKWGVYFITGNHEYYAGVDEWCAHLAQLGITVLRNRRVEISAGVNGDNFYLAGVDDWNSRHFQNGGPDLPKTLEGRDPSKMIILLAHQPAAVDEASSFGVDLQLSGHTHGGQIWPFTYLVYLQQPYSTGLHRHRETSTQIYISPGTGFWGPPMRLGTFAEITNLTLRRGGSGGH